MNAFRYNHDELPSLVHNSALDLAVKMGHLPPSSPPLNAMAEASSAVPAEGGGDDTAKVERF